MTMLRVLRLGVTVGIALLLASGSAAQIFNQYYQLRYKLKIKIFQSQDKVIILFFIILF